MDDASTVAGAVVGAGIVSTIFRAGALMLRANILTSAVVSTMPLVAAAANAALETLRTRGREVISDIEYFLLYSLGL
jgi:hypothetical protein